MRIRDRDIRRVIGAPLQVRHWRALRRMLAVYVEPAEAIRRYLTNSGDYPWTPRLRTPLGVVAPRLDSYHDLLTVNEVFCRQDYGPARDVRTVVDIGANVGLATLFFLTRDSALRVWCFEPDPVNLARLRETLRGFEDRYEVVEAAVTHTAATSVRFSMQGRYGHVSDEGSEVAAVNIGDALAMPGVPVDLVKIDTEGTEAVLVAAIPPGVARAVVYEDNAGRTRWIRNSVRSHA